MTRCLLIREGGLLCPLPLTTYLPIQRIQHCPRVSPFSGLDDALQSEGTADDSATPLPLASFYLSRSPGVWVGEVPRPLAHLAQGTGGVGLAWGTIPPAVGAAEACKLVGGWLGMVPVWDATLALGSAKSQPAQHR